MLYDSMPDASMTMMCMPVCQMTVCQMPDAKKHSDNTVIMVQPIVRAQNLDFGHCITQNILYNMYASTAAQMQQQ